MKIDTVIFRILKYLYETGDETIEQAYIICEEAFYEAEKYGYKTYARRLL